MRVFSAVPKLAFDMVVAIALLVLLAPLMALLALAVRWQLGPPALFRQTRPGLQGALFACYKFRTMTEACDSAGRILPDSDRLTRFGVWLRKLGLDELPQLVNVVRREMSLVGPRPLLPEYLPLYNARQALRHTVRPGITGWAQVHGRNALSWELRFELDVWYVQNRSFWLDLRILACTALQLLRPRGIAREGQATMQPFTGTLPTDAPQRGET